MRQPLSAAKQKASLGTALRRNFFLSLVGLRLGSWPWRPELAPVRAHSSVSSPLQDPTAQTGDERKRQDRLSPALRSTWTREGAFSWRSPVPTNRRRPASRDPWPDTVRQDLPALGEDAEWALNHPSHAEISGATARWALDAAFS